MKIKVASLGCRLNQAEIQSVKTRLMDFGHTMVTGNSDADVVIINSCVVTHNSERKTRNLLSRGLRTVEQDPRGMVIVTSCYATSIQKDGNVYYVPNDYKYLIPDLVENPSLFDSLDEAKAARFSFPPATRSSRTRINLKIQDGCDNYCAYCIIPYVRGGPVSRPADDILEEFRVLLDAGYHEFLLTGVMIGNYSHEDTGLSELMEKMLAVEGDFRLHCSSLSPHAVSEKMMDLVTHQKMVKHLHLSLQSGSDRVLHLMNRKYTTDQYRQIVKTIRGSDPLFNFTTDLIVGFPGETEDDFRHSLEFVREMNFSHVHTFRFSPREGTKAAEMEQTVSEQEKAERSHEIISLSSEQKTACYQQFNGLTTRMLTEPFRRGYTGGFNQYYVPVRVYEKLKRNTFYDVTTAVSDDGTYLIGRLVDG